MPSIFSLLPSHGLERGCINKLSLSMQLRVPSWESNEIKGIWIPGWFHGAESLPTPVITDLSLLTYVRDKHLSCLSHWSFESLLQQLSCTLFTLQACKTCKETVHHKFQGPKKNLPYTSSAFKIREGNIHVYICTHRHKVRKNLDWCVPSDRAEPCL